MPVYKALTCKNPYGSAFFLASINRKNIENRTFPWRHRGDLLIHTSKQTDKQYWDAALEVCKANGWDPSRDRLTFGAIIGVVEMYGCYFSERQIGGWGFPGFWHYKIRNPRPFKEPIFCSGHLYPFEIEISDLDSLIVREVLAI